MTARSGAGPVVAIVGAAGAGGSLVARGVAERLVAMERPTRLVHRWDIVDNPEYPAAGLLQADPRYVRSCTARMSPVPRLLFVLWASTMALSDRHGVPRPGEVLLLDGHWMEHAAGEIAGGVDRAWVERVAAGLPAADLVVYLRLSPEEAWRRQPSGARESFLAHQQTVHDVLDSWADAHGWVTIDATRPLHVVLEEVVQQVPPPQPRR